MAQFIITEGSGLSISFTEIAEIPSRIMDEMINAQADIALKAQIAEAQTLGMYSGGYTSHTNNERHTTPGNSLPGQTRSRSTGALAKSIKKSSPKSFEGVRSVKIYFAGNRKRSGTTTTNTEIAFLNEYGSRNINQRNFVFAANKKCENQTTAAAARIYDNWLKSKGF